MCCWFWVVSGSQLTHIQLWALSRRVVLRSFVGVCCCGQAVSAAVAVESDVVRHGTEASVSAGAW